MSAPWTKVWICSGSNFLGEFSVIKCLKTKSSKTKSFHRTK